MQNDGEGEKGNGEEGILIEVAEVEGEVIEDAIRVGGTVECGEGAAVIWWDLKNV